MTSLTKTRGRRGKSRFYHIRWNKVQVCESLAAKILGVSIEQVKEWDEQGAPIIAERLLLLWDQKHVGIEGWNGWLFSRGVLLYKGQRFTPRTILYDRNFRENLELETATMLRKIQNAAK